MHESLTTDPSRDQPQPTHGQRQLVSCFWCERIHAAEHPVSVCSVCSASYSTLRALDMRGAYPLNDRAIDEVLTRTSPGNFALGYMVGDSFGVFFVGRSDVDVNASLHEWVGMPSCSASFAFGAKAPWEVDTSGQPSSSAPLSGYVGNANSPYTHFAYSYSDSSAAAFAEERRNFEDFGGCRALDNQSEPFSAAA